MTEQQFQSRCEALAEHAVHTADNIASLNKETPDVKEAKRYLSLARTAAQESELWLGKAMVAFACARPGQQPPGLGAGQ